MFDRITSRQENAVCGGTLRPTEVPSGGSDDVQITVQVDNQSSVGEPVDFLAVAKPVDGGRRTELRELEFDVAPGESKTESVTLTIPPLQPGEYEIRLINTEIDAVLDRVEATCGTLSVVEGLDDDESGNNEPDDSSDRQTGGFGCPPGTIFGGVSVGCIPTDGGDGGGDGTTGGEQDDSQEDGTDGSQDDGVDRPVQPDCPPGTVWGGVGRGCIPIDGGGQDLGQNVSIQSCDIRPSNPDPTGQLTLVAVVENTNSVPVQVQVNWEIGGSRWGQGVLDIPASGSREATSTHRVANVRADIGRGQKTVEAFIVPPVIEGDRPAGP